MRRQIVRELAAKHGPEAREDMRRLVVWVQVARCKSRLNESPARANKKIDEIVAKYPEDEDDLNNIITLSRMEYEQTLFKESNAYYIDGHGKVYLTWCLKSFNERWEDG